MATKRLRVALIGAGMIANAGHVPAWRNAQDEAELVAVFSRDLGKAQRTAQRAGIPAAYDSVDKMLAEAQPDVAVICTPNTSHHAITLKALRAGAHVLCEKPAATTRAEIEEMFAVARKVGRTLMIGQSGRFNPTMSAAKAFADEGRLGEVYYAETSALRRRGVPQWGRFHIKADSGGGALLDIGVHALDGLMWITGNPRVVAANGAIYTKLANQDEGLITSLADSGAPVGVFDPRPYDYHEFDVEDLGVGMLRLENGATITIRASWAANVPPGMGGTVVIGTVGGIRMNPFTLVTNLGHYQVDVTPKVPEDPSIPFYGHWREVQHLIGVLRGREELIVKPAEVINVIAALEALYISAEEGHEVWL
ncbi:MAG: Gfo/Idh/MocA family oxidoreductase [Chloroflexota bacterium]